MLKSSLSVDTTEQARGGGQLKDGRFKSVSTRGQGKWVSNIGKASQRVHLQAGRSGVYVKYRT